MFERKVILGFVRVHVLHHADERTGIYGMWMIRELERHGYRVSPGTVYPLLHEMEREGVLRSRAVRSGGRTRRVYRTTPKGRKALERLRAFVSELHREVV